MLSFDTTPEAQAAQIDALRRLGAEGRIAQAIAMSARAREMALAGIHRRHPDYSDEDAVRALVWLFHGADLARKIWGDAAREP